MRKFLKILHTVASCGLIGGLGCYMLLLIAAPQETPAAYADLRQSISAISRYVLLPSLGVALASGLFAMAAHPPFLDKGWVWIKAAMGVLMFILVLSAVGESANHAASVSKKIAAGEATPAILEQALRKEWYALWVVMALSIANVVLGVWRPRRILPASQAGPAAGAVQPK